MMKGQALSPEGAGSLSHCFGDVSSGLTVEAGALFELTSMIEWSSRSTRLLYIPAATKPNSSIRHGPNRLNKGATAIFWLGR
jgi:hypothetical protein